jgi:ferritin
MNAHPDVIKALNDAHNAEHSAYTRWHDQEHTFRQGDRKLPKLAKWFDKRNHEAKDREHDVRNTILKHGGTIERKLGDTKVSDDPEEALDMACKTIDGLAAAHQKVHEAVSKASESAGPADKAYYRGISERHIGFAKDLHNVYHAGEQKQQLLKDVGPELFNAMHAKK